MNLARRPFVVARGQRGGALLIAVIALTVSSIMAGAILQVTLSVNSRAKADADNLRAFYMAEAGLAEAFEALRVGKRGQIGSPNEPATFGDGLLWVESRPVDGQSVQLRATAIVASGLATLSLIVEPVDVSLGFFSEEEFRIADVVFIDGFDSRLPVPENQITVDSEVLATYDDVDNGLLFYEGIFYRYQSARGNTYTFDDSVSTVELSEHPTYGNGTSFDIDHDDFLDEDLEGLNRGIPSGDFLDQEYQGVLEYFGIETHGDSDAQSGWGGVFGTWAYQLDQLLNGEGSSTGGDPAEPEALTIDSGGALLGSNGTIALGGNGEAIVIDGDAIPGEGEEVLLSDGSYVTGDTDPRAEAVELVPVEVPAIALEPAYVHDSALPMVISPGHTGFESMEVVENAELIVYGPATLVVGDLTLQPGAHLLLDTTDGDVELFVTGGFDLAAGSLVTTTGQAADEVSVQVDAIDSAGGVAPVRLEATAQFYGSIYAPETEVHVGADFELTGSLVARVIDLAPGATLHYDRAGEEKVPKIVSWRIVQISNAARSIVVNPFAALGKSVNELLPMTEAHDLGGIELDLVYVDQMGAQKTYSGPESDFDWDDVSEVKETMRTGWDDWASSDQKDWSDWAEWWAAWIENVDWDDGSWSSWGDGHGPK